MKTDALIQKLSKELSATQPFTPVRTARFIFALCLAIFGGQLLLRALRPDVGSVLMSTTFLLFAGGLLLGAICLALALAISATPGRNDDSRLYYVALVPFLFSLLSLFSFPWSPSPETFWSELGAIICVKEALLLSLLPSFAIFGVLRRRAVTRPLRVGAFVGLLSVALAASALTLCCTNSLSLHVATCHFLLPAFFSCVIGGIAGRLFLRW